MTFFERSEIKDTDRSGKANRARALLFLLSSLTVLLLCSKCSPLYTFNDWCDMNWFHTMGKGMFSGLVPYRDLYEQKGPVLFFIIGLVSFFSERSLIGVFLLEAVALFFYQHFSYKIARRYLTEAQARAAAVATAVLTATTWSFNQGGGSVEEYCLPLFAYGLYKLLVYLEDGRTLSFGEMFIFGLIVGVILWSKYLTALYFAIIMLIWMQDMLFVRHDGKNLLRGILAGFLGVVAVTLPVLLYFAANGALGDLFTVYFLDNLFHYSDPQTVVHPLVKYIGIYLSNFILDAIAIYGLAVYFRESRKTQNRRTAVCLLVFYCVQVLEVLLIGYYTYYYLIFAPFTAMMTVPLVKRLSAYREKRREAGARFPKKRTEIALAVTAGLLVCLLGSNVTLELFRRDYPQIEVAEYIEEQGDETPTLLCYKMLDYGFYRAAGLSPTTRFYALNNYAEESFPEIYEEFERYVEEGVCEFVVVYTEDYNEERELFDLYEPVAEYDYTMRDNNYVTYSYEFTLLMLAE